MRPWPFPHLHKHTNSPTHSTCDIDGPYQNLPGATQRSVTLPQADGILQDVNIAWVKPVIRKFKSGPIRWIAHTDAHILIQIYRCRTPEFGEKFFPLPPISPVASAWSSLSHIHWNTFSLSVSSRTRKASARVAAAMRSHSHNTHLILQYTPSSPLSYKWGISHANGPCDTGMSHVTYECVVSHMNGSCHAWVRSTPTAPRHVLCWNFRLHETNKTWVLTRVPSDSNINNTRLIRQWCTVLYRSESATHKCTHVRTHTHIHIHMHKRAHTHTHTHTHTWSQFVHINSWIL